MCWGRESCAGGSSFWRAEERDNETPRRSTQLRRGVLFGILPQIVQGVDRPAIDPDLEVAVDAGGAPGAARLGDGLALIDLLARRDAEAGVVGVVGLHPVVVADDDQVTVPPSAAWTASP